MAHETYWGGASPDDGATTLWTSTRDQPWHSFEDVDPAQWPADGIYWQWLVSEQVSGSKELEMGICRLDPGGRHLLHRHPQRAELYHVTAGAATVTVGDETRRMLAGDTVYIPADVVHGFVNDGDEVFELVFVYDHPRDLVRPDYVLEEPGS